MELMYREDSLVAALGPGDVGAGGEGWAKPVKGVKSYKFAVIQ